MSVRHLAGPPFPCAAGWPAQSPYGIGFRRSQDGSKAIQRASDGSGCQIEPSPRPCYKARNPPPPAFPRMKLVSIPANPAPEDAVVGASRRRTASTLRYARWAPPPGRKGTVCMFQGRAEFIEKYFETVRDLQARGFAVATLDWRGQGLSDRALADRRKGHVKRLLRIRHRPRRLHGAGGAAGLPAAAVRARRIRWAARFCCAPAMRAGAGSTAWC